MSVLRHSFFVSYVPLHGNLSKSESANFAACISADGYPPSW
ncbi:MAG: hypothetical protein Q4D90_07030 [bacterium]|nr:hypothetical protein [bacterium]